MFLGAFVLGMLLTPPDVFSQTLLALPMYALYEIALLFCGRTCPTASYWPGKRTAGDRSSRSLPRNGEVTAARARAGCSRGTGGTRISKH